MVHRQVSALGPRLALAAALAGLLLAFVAAPAGAANRRIAISNYQWSDADLKIDLGEHVSWYWTGPDTMHSVTGLPPNAVGLDSDPQTNQPQHKIGDSFKLDFDKPGVYTFQCKLHSTVRGTVTVSAKKGDPDSEPDGIPESGVDLKAPHLDGVALSKTSFGRRGTALQYSLNEKARVSVDYYRLRRRGKRRFAGWAGWKAGHVGYNSVRFGKRGKHFKAKPGRYVGVVRAEDRYGNLTRPQRVEFKIFPRKRRGHRR